MTYIPTWNDTIKLINARIAVLGYVLKTYLMENQKFEIKLF